MRKYRNLQKRLNETTAELTVKQLSRKLGILQRRLLRLNRSWKVGIATAALVAWMAGPMQAQVFPSVINLDTLSSGQGLVINGIDPDDESGNVGWAGDINGDGINDIVIGATEADPNGLAEAGETYVVFGTRNFGDTLNLADLNGTNGFVINGKGVSHRSGLVATGAGDFNGDGTDDLLIGAQGAGPNDNAAGETYLIFGKATFSDTLNLSDLNGTNGILISGIDENDRAGISASGAGDFNDDGFDDIVIGTFSTNINNDGHVGTSYVVFGANSLSDSLNLADLNGTNGFKIRGIDSYDYAGGAVSGAGDVNGDGLDDIILSGYYGDPNGNSNAGESYVVFGTKMVSDSMNLADLDGTNGFVINGIDVDDESSTVVSRAGDVNDDGFDDIILSAPYGDPNGNTDAGECYVVFGANTFADSLNLSNLNGTNGFVINGINAGDNLDAVSRAGDLNGDGIDDILLGAPYADPNGNMDAGQSYVVFGNKTFAASLNLSDLDGTNGFTINGADAGDYSGIVSDLGDVNGDGVDDMIIGATYGDPNGSSDAGESYVIFGRDVNASIGDLKATLGLAVFPNPTSGILSLQATPFEQAANIEISLYDLLGRTVEAPHARRSTDHFELDMRALPKGTYLLQVIADGEVGTSRIVKE